jgi:hypothetical protein
MRRRARYILHETGAFVAFLRSREATAARPRHHGRATASYRKIIDCNKIYIVAAAQQSGAMAPLMLHRMCTLRFYPHLPLVLIQIRKPIVKRSGMLGWAGIAATACAEQKIVFPPRGGRRGTV